MNILLLGASGFIGNNLNLFYKNNKVIRTYKNNYINNSIYFDLDSTTLPSVIKEHNITHVIFLGGIVKFDLIYKNQKYAKFINVECTIKRIKETIDSGAIPIYFSSESVFSGRGCNYEETEQPEPIFEYGQQKFEVEKFILGHADKYMILRLAKVFSSERNPTSLVTAWLEKLEKNEDICVAIDNFFTPIHIIEVDSIVNSLFMMEKYGIYNLCSPVSYSRSEMLDIVIGEFSKYSKYKGDIVRKELNSISGAEMLPKNTSLSSSKTIEVTGYTAQNFSYWARYITHSYMRKYIND